MRSHHVIKIAFISVLSAAYTSGWWALFTVPNPEVHLPVQIFVTVATIGIAIGCFFSFLNSLDE